MTGACFVAQYVIYFKEWTCAFEKHVHLLLYKYKLSLSYIMCHWKPVLIDVLSGWSVHWWKWGVKVPHYYATASFSFYGSQCLPSMLRCSYIGCIYIYNLQFSSLLGLILWSLCSVLSLETVFIFFFWNSLYFKVYFVWYKYCYPHFLLISICMEYLFPSPHFQCVCVRRSEVDPL